MDSVTAMLYVSVGIIVLVVAMYVVGYFKSFKRNKSSLVKTPKLRPRVILQDEENFGSAIVQGVEYVGSAMQRGYVLLLGQDGKIFKQHYWEDQIYPKNALQAVGGAERALWGVRTTKNKKDFDIDLEKQSYKLREELIVTKAEKEIKVNEAATLPDQMTELIDKFAKKEKEQIGILRK
mgnify:CR=1 FL=1